MAKQKHGRKKLAAYKRPVHGLSSHRDFLCNMNPTYCGSTKRTSLIAWDDKHISCRKCKEVLKKAAKESLGKSAMDAALRARPGRAVSTK